MPAVLPLEIIQGATFSRTWPLSQRDYNSSASTNNTGYAIGATSITLSAGGTGSISAGDFVKFNTGQDNTRAYKVATGIADLSLGGTLVLVNPGIAVAIPAGIYTVSIYDPVDLTGYIARAQLRQYPKSPTIAAEFTCTITPLTGEISVLLTATQTSAIPTNGTSYDNYANYNWDLEIEDAGGIVTRVFNGPVTVSPEVTR